MDDGYLQQQTGPEYDFLLYTREQFLSLRQATIATSIIALVAAVIVLSSFFYLWLVDRKRANRISLRCVVIACAANGIDSIMNLSMSFVEGPTSFCRAGGIISNISRLISASFLAIVGINLVLIFVINVKRRDLLEYFYYPCAFVYVLICTVVSVYKAVTADYSNKVHDTCWYLNYVIERHYSVFSWMWYYGFLFFINLLAGLSSAIALYKLIHEQRALRKNVDHTTYMGQASTNEVETRFQRRQSAVLSKVVSRCIIYPLIPLVVNIWGFGIQMMMTIRDDRPPFVLVMFDTVFACLEGFFVLMVFFTDPALTAFMSDRLQYWCKVYVEEHRLVEIRNDSSAGPEKKKDRSHTLYIMPPTDNGDTPNDKPTDWGAAIIHANATSRYSATNHKSVPMRRIGIPPSSLTQLSSHYNIRQLSFCTLPTTSDHTVDTAAPAGHPQTSPVPWKEPQPKQSHEQGQYNESSTANPTNNNIPAHFTTCQESVIHVVFIPYKSAVWARLCHYLLSRFVLHIFTPSASRSAPRSSTTIELRSYSQPPPPQPPQQQPPRAVVEEDNATTTISNNDYDVDDGNNTIGTGHSNDLPIEPNSRYRFSISAQTRHY